MRNERKSTPSRSHAQSSEEQSAHGRPSSAVDGGVRFHFAIWTVFVAQVWILDFGRPVISLYLSSGESSLSGLGMSDYAHVAYIYITALCIIKLQESSPLPVSRIAHQILLISFVTGVTIHMVADAVQHRLLRAGGTFHLPIQAQPMLQNVQPSVVASFCLLDYLDEHLGHQMWYLALYLLFLLYFSSCFYRIKSDTTSQPAAEEKSQINKAALPHLMSSLLFYALLFLSVLHEWYAVTEAQVFPQFATVSLAMFVVFLWRHHNGGKIDTNGTFLVLRSLFTFLLVAIWVAMLWTDEALRHKYRENWLYIPEPWSYASLYLMNHSETHS